MGQSVPEGVFEVGEEARLIEKLRGLKLGEAPAERLVGQSGGRLEEGKCNVFADDRGGLEQVFVLG